MSARISNDSPPRWWLDSSGNGDPPYYIDRHRSAANSGPLPIGRRFEVVALTEGAARIKVNDAVSQVGIGDDIFGACGLVELVDDWGAATVVSISTDRDLMWVEIDLGGILFRLRVGQSFGLRTDSTGRDWRPIVKFPELAIIVGNKSEIYKSPEGEIDGFLTLIEVVDTDADGAVLSVDGVVIPLDNNAGVQILPPDGQDAEALPPLPIYVRTMLVGRTVRVFVDGSIAEYPTFCARRVDVVLEKIPTVAPEDPERHDPDGLPFAQSA